MNHDGMALHKTVTGKPEPFRQQIKYVGLDFLTASLTWSLFNLLRYYEVAKYEFDSLSDFLLYFQVVKGQIMIPLFWLALYFLSGYYNKPFGKSWIGELFSTFITVVIGSVILFFIVVLNDLPPSFEIYYRLFFSLCVIQFVLTYSARFLITGHAIRKSKSRKWVENVLVVGTGAGAVKIRKYLQDSGYHIVGFVSENGNAGNERGAGVERFSKENGLSGRKVSPASPVIDPQDIIGTTDAIPEILQQYKIDEIVVAVKGLEVVHLLYQFYRYRLPVKVMADKNNFLSKAKVKTIAGIPLIDLTDNNFSEAEKNIKWLFDKVFSLCVLILLSPLYAYLAIMVKRNSPGPVFFRQERIGYRGKPFMIYKFRTMFSNASKEGPLLTARDDKRVTTFGRFMRKYRLDEIPQFWNVLRGDMSLVGPRPEQRFYIEQIVRKAPYYYLLHNVRPGITSWGMVKYGYAETVDKMIERLDYDILYYENMSLVLDIKILLYTIQIVLAGKGV